MAEVLPILYSFRRCPYAMRARMAIYQSGLACELREVVLRDKPQAMLDVSPKATVPVFVDVDGQVCEESLALMLLALSRNDPDQWLLPEQGGLDGMHALIKENDDSFKYHLDRYKYPNRYEGVDGLSHREHGSAFLEKLNSRLTESNYLYGERASLADIAIFPFVRQFAHVDKAWFDNQPWSALQGWLNTWLESELFKAVMPKYAQWQPGHAPIYFSKD